MSAPAAERARFLLADDEQYVSVVDIEDLLRGLEQVCRHRAVIAAMDADLPTTFTLKGAEAMVANLRRILHGWGDQAMRQDPGWATLFDGLDGR